MMKWMRVIAFVPMVFMMITIWGFSANTGETSAKQSMGIVYRVVCVAEDVLGQEWTKEEKEVIEEKIHTPVRKIAHISEYLILTCTTAFPLLLFWKDKRKISFISFVYCGVYAGLDEVHQLYVPDRAGRFTDVCVDSIGILLGILIFRLIYGRFHSSEV